MLRVKIGTLDSVLDELQATARKVDSGKAVTAPSAITFASYEELHRVLTPKRLEIIRAMAGAGALSIREVARRVGRDFKGVHTDVSALVLAGLVERDADGFEFSYNSLHFEFDISAAA